MRQLKASVVIEVEFVKTLGSGLVLLTCGSQRAMPLGALDNGLGLVTHLAQTAPRDLKVLVAEVAPGLSREWSALGVQGQRLQQYLERLPSLMSATVVETDMLEGLSITAPPASAQSVARNLAAEIVERAKSDGLIDAAGLRASTCQAMITALLCQLLAKRIQLAAVRSECQNYLARLSEPAACPAAPSEVPMADRGCVADLLVEAVEAQRLTVEAADAIERGVMASAAGPERLMARVTQAIECWNGLLEELGDQLSAETSGREQLERACTALREGKLPQAASALGELEALYLHGAQEQDGAVFAQPELAVIVRCWQGRVAEIGQEWGEAASHYAVAQRLLSDSDLSTWLEIRLLKIDAMAAQSEHAGICAPMIEAVQLLSQTCAELDRIAMPVEWARTHAKLGHLLLALAQRDHRPERFLAAAMHLAPAIDALAGEQLIDEWARAQLALGHALRGQGEHECDMSLLVEAAAAYRCALEVLTQDGAPAEWAKAQSCLGATLVRIGETASDTTALDEAVAALRALLDCEVLKACDARPGAAKADLGRAYLALAAHRDDLGLLEEAVALFKSALEQSAPALDSVAMAAVCNLLGSALWALGEQAGDLARVREAAAYKARALTMMEQSTSDTEVEQLRDELDTLQDVMDHMKARQAAASRTSLAESA